jgi:hypothetical protein
VTVFGSGYLIDYGGQDGVPGYRCVFNTAITFDFPIGNRSLQECRMEAVRSHLRIAAMRVDMGWVAKEHHLVELERPSDRASLFMYDVNALPNGQLEYSFKGRGTTGQGNRIIGEWNVKAPLAIAHRRRHLATLYEQVMSRIDRQFGRQASEIRLILPLPSWELPLGPGQVEVDATLGGERPLDGLSEMTRRSAPGVDIGPDGVVVRREVGEDTFAREARRLLAATPPAPMLPPLPTNGYFSEAEIQRARQAMGLAPYRLPAPTPPSVETESYSSSHILDDLEVMSRELQRREVNAFATPMYQQVPAPRRPSPDEIRERNRAAGRDFNGITRTTTPPVTRPATVTAPAVTTPARRPVESLSERERARMVSWLKDLCAMLGITENEAAAALRVHPDFEKGTIEVRTNDGKIVGRGVLPACEKIDDNAPLPIEPYDFADTGYRQGRVVTTTAEGRKVEDPNDFEIEVSDPGQPSEPTRASLLELD